MNAFGFDTHNYDIGNDRSEVFIGGHSLGLTPASRGGVGFLGFVATAGSTFSTVSIVGRGFDVYNGFDNFTTAAGLAGGVPEPATWAMMIVGFGLVGGAVRRRNRVVTRVSLA